MTGAESTVTGRLRIVVEGNATKAGNAPTGELVAAAKAEDRLAAAAKRRGDPPPRGGAAGAAALRAGSAAGGSGTYGLAAGGQAGHTDTLRSVLEADRRRMQAERQERWANPTKAKLHGESAYEQR